MTLSEVRDLRLYKLVKTAQVSRVRATDTLQKQLGDLLLSVKLWLSHSQVPLRLATHTLYTLLWNTILIIENALNARTRNQLAVGYTSIFLNYRVSSIQESKISVYFPQIPGRKLPMSWFCGRKLLVFNSNGEIMTFITVCNNLWTPH